MNVAKPDCTLEWLKEALASSQRLTQGLGGLSLGLILKAPSSDVMCSQGWEPLLLIRA